MREIEIKARVRDANTVLNALEEKGVRLSETVKQRDIVYGRDGATGTKEGNVWLRVRVENDEKYIFTLKRNMTGKFDSIEHETVVEDLDEITNIIKELGFELFSDITKFRRKSHAGDVEICYDELPGLGDFIEAEKLCEHDEDNAKVEHELWEFLESLGVVRSDEAHDKYDIMLYEKTGRRINPHET